MTALAGAKSKIKNYPKIIVAVLLCVALVIGIIVILLNQAPTKTATQENSLANDAFIKGDKALALKHAKKALEKDPNNMNTMLLVAKLSKEKNPDEAKQYYAQALDVIIKYDKPDEPGKPASIYWAAADLAQRAGQIELAKKYYAKVAPAADPQNDYEQSIAAESKVRLEGQQ